jgi:Ulp1 family protease
MFGIKYEDFWMYREGKYMGCEIANGYMHLLEETYNNGGKNKFFAHQFFIGVLEDEMTFERVVNKQDFKKDWAKWEKLFFPTQHNDHWLLIVADKVNIEILIYDSLAHANKHHFMSYLN